MLYDEFLTSTDGRPVLSYEQIREFRKEDQSQINPLRFMAQEGAQERGLSRDVDIQIYGGSRGGGKTAALLMEALYDIFNPHLDAIVFRKEKGDLDTIKTDAYKFYQDFGRFNKADTDLTWYFTNGGKLKFSNYSDAYEDFKTRLQGRQYSYIGIDEITQMPFDKFKYITTCNRNAFGIRNRILGTCNPDPDSWVRKFIDWWIDKDGNPIPSRDGVVRYCFMDGDSVSTIYWGDSPEDVYRQCKDLIDPLWNPAYEAMGLDKKTMFVKSVTFTRAGVEENRILLMSSPEYLANLAQQSEEQKSRDLAGNWNYKAAGDDMITQQDMENFFKNPQMQSGRHYASCDAAFEGGDNCVIYHWIGWHIEDVFVCRADSRTTVASVKAKLREWGVLEEHFTYDLNGLGQIFKGFFPRAVPFNNQGAIDRSLRGVYKDLKSLCAYKFAHKLIDGGLSINPRLLSRRYSGHGYESVELRQILMRERKAIRASEKDYDKGFALINKDTMKKLVGHSPDFIEGMMMRMVFDQKESRGQRPKGLPRIVKRYSI